LYAARLELNPSLSLFKTINERAMISSCNLVFSTDIYSKTAMDQLRNGKF
jgi:hypothetical protein